MSQNLRRKVSITDAYKICMFFTTTNISFLLKIQWTSDNMLFFGRPIIFFNLTVEINGISFSRSAMVGMARFCQQIYFIPIKYKDGNNRPSSVNQTSLVHNHDKAGNKCYTQDNTNTRENPRVTISAREE